MLWMKKCFIETLRNVVPYIYVYMPVSMWSGFIKVNWMSQTCSTVDREKHKKCIHELMNQSENVIILEKRIHSATKSIDNLC